jgi:hypothetical protein
MAIERIRWQFSLYQDQLDWLREFSKIRRESVSFCMREIIDAHKREYERNQLGTGHGNDSLPSRKGKK